MKRLDFLGDSLSRLRAFPDDARAEAGFQLRRVRNREHPNDWKPMKTVGAGVREIRIREQSGAWRVIYLASLPDRVAVSHAFQKKTQTTARTDIELAGRRYRELKAAE